METDGAIQFHSLVAACREENFADDLDLPDLDACEWWTKQDVRTFFESGGDVLPSRTHNAVSKPQAASSLPPAAWAAAPVPQPQTSLCAVTAHVDHAVSCVRLWRDELGLLGAAGAVLCASGSWDCLIKVWSVSDAAGRPTPGAPRLLSELAADQVRRPWPAGCALRETACIPSLLVSAVYQHLA
jgi:hypothetical protein